MIACSRFGVVVSGRICTLVVPCVTCACIPGWIALHCHYCCWAARALLVGWFVSCCWGHAPPPWMATGACIMYPDLP